MLRNGMHFSELGWEWYDIKQLLYQQVGLEATLLQHEHATQLLAKYKRTYLRRVEMFHVLIGSGLSVDGETPIFDLDGDDSIVTYLKNMAIEHGVEY